jgi:hypothetical protein
MIPIKIGKTAYRIKSISELNTREFLELTKLPAIDTVKYIAWQTGADLNSAFFAVTSSVVESAIGTIPDITKLPRPKGFDYSKLIDTVGQRHQVENSGKTGYELLVYCLAVAQARSNNSDQVAVLEADYLTRPFTDILPAGFFFFQNYKTGRKSGRRYLSWLPALIKTQNLRKLQAWKGSTRTQIT